MGISSRFRSAHVAAFVLLAVMAVAALPDRTTVGFDGNGLTSLRYGSTEFLASGELKVVAAAFSTPQGATIPADLSATRTIDRAASRVTTTFPWGSVIATYLAHGNRVDVSIRVANRSPWRLDGIVLEPMSLRLPSRPREYDGVTPMMALDPGNPPVVPMSFESGLVVATFEDIGKPVLFGFPSASNRPASTEFPLRVATMVDASDPASYPRIHRPIAPGGSDQFTFALRFGNTGAATATLASDLYARFARTFSPAAQWADRRPIGQLVLATTTAGWPTNPRGWLLDPKIDVTTPRGLAAFRDAILAWADRSVEILKGLNAQGMITWDIEGEQWPQPTTYLCDPRVLSQAAPEMDAIADAYFKKFTDAGLRVGVCVRPQRLQLGSGAPAQRYVDDPAPLLIEKIAYAKHRWNASIFYIDSNGNPGLPIDASIFKRVLDAHPDVLLVPEHENARYYAYSAPYRELRRSDPGTPASVRALYPGAFGVTYVADGDFGRYGDAVTRAVRDGDILLVRGWFADPANAYVKQIYDGIGRR